MAPTAAKITKIVINFQSSPGFWNCVTTWNDGHSETLGLSTYNVQYWLDRGATLTDNTFQFVQVPNSTGQSPSVTRGTGKTVSINTSDSSTSTDG